MHLETLLRALGTEAFDLAIAFVSSGHDDPLVEGLGIARFDYSVLDRRPAFTQSFGSPLTLATQLLRLRRLIASTRPDIVHTHTAVAAALGRLAARTVPDTVVVNTVHAFAGHRHQPAYRRVPLGLAERVLERLTDHTIVPSRAMRDLGVESGVLRPDRVDVIPHGLRSAPTDDDPVELLRREVGIGVDVPLVGFFGRLVPQKGVEDLAPMIAGIAEEVPDVELLVVGDGSEMGELRHAVASLGAGSRVHFLGWRRDARRLMGAVDVVVIPSRWEAFGLVGVEAMAAGKPVAAYAVEGIPEVVVDGETGVLVLPGDVDRLSEVVAGLLSSPAQRTRMGAAGVVRFQNRFDHTAMADATADLYRRLLDSAARR